MDGGSGLGVIQSLEERVEEVLKGGGLDGGSYTVKGERESYWGTMNERC